MKGIDGLMLPNFPQITSCLASFDTFVAFSTTVFPLLSFTVPTHLSDALISNRKLQNEFNNTPTRRDSTDRDEFNLLRKYDALFSQQMYYYAVSVTVIARLM